MDLTTYGTLRGKLLTSPTGSPPDYRPNGSAYVVQIMDLTTYGTLRGKPLTYTEAEGRRRDA